MPTLAQGKPANKFLVVSVRKELPDREKKINLEVEFSAAPGFTILFGPSGAGKTTVLNCVAGLVKPDSGSIRAGDCTLFDASQRVSLPVAQRNIGYVLQDLALFPHLTVEQNIEYGVAHLQREERKDRVGSMLQDFRIDHLSRQRPGEISGGERQRTALARSLVTDPRVLLLDEPLTALDAPTKSKLMDDLRRWNEAHQIPILFVTHSREEVVALGERVLVIDHGRIIAQGAPHEVLTAPRQETIAHLAGFENIFDAEVVSIHEDRGTLSCRLMNKEAGTAVMLETPLVRAQEGIALKVGIRAGDILLATVMPAGLSAQNIIPGRVISLERKDMSVFATVDSGVEFRVQLTLAARDSLQLHRNQPIWLVIKTHSCHLMQPEV